MLRGGLTFYKKEESDVGEAKLKLFQDESNYLDNVKGINRFFMNN